jgi:hypothetical protein
MCGASLRQVKAEKLVFCLKLNSPKICINFFFSFSSFLLLIRSYILKKRTLSLSHSVSLCLKILHVRVFLKSFQIIFIFQIFENIIQINIKLLAVAVADERTNEIQFFENPEAQNSSRM